MAGDICRSMSSSKICTESDVYYDNLYIQQARPIDFWPVKTKFSLPLAQGQKVDLSSFQKLKTMLSNTELGTIRRLVKIPWSSKSNYPYNAFVYEHLSWVFTFLMLYFT